MGTMHFTRWIEALCLLIGEMGYAYYVVMRFRKGLPRLLAILPLLPPSLLVPWIAPSAAERILHSFLFLGMIMSKLLLLALGQGPAAEPLALSTFPRFVSAMTFSLPLKDTKTESKEKKDIDRKQEDDERVGEDVGGRRSGLSDGLVQRRTGGKVGSESSIGGAKDDDGILHPEVNSSWVEKVVTSQKGQIVVLRSVFYFIVFASFLRMLLARKHLSYYVLVVEYGFFIYFACLFFFEAARVIPACVLGVQLQPPFNMPFLADSLADFWGRRWNLLVNNVLRVSVYDPILTFLSPETKPVQFQRAISTLATFLVSGLVHEVMLFYINQTWPTWEMTGFFVVNGVGTILESWVTKSRIGFPVPRLVRRAYTLTFVYLTACWLFFPPFVRTGMVDNCLGDLRVFVDSIEGMIIWQH